jgi:LPXTG-site transpeptidase (sortase) family protein
MTQDTPIKKYPQTTAEVAQMLGIQSTSDNLPMASFPVADLPVAGLLVVPVVDNQPSDQFTHSPASAAVENAHPNPISADKSDLQSIEQKAASQPAYVKAAKALLPFAAIFLIGIVLYYFFFTKVDFTTVFKPNTTVSTPQVTQIQQLEQQNRASYNAWIASYYYDVTEPKLLDPESDNSGNGLSNFQKYLLNLNPKSYDTLGLGMADSQAIAQGINPTTGGVLTDEQKSIISKYVDMEVVMNRLALYNLQNPSRVAGASTVGNYNNNNPGTFGGTNQGNNYNYNSGSTQVFTRGNDIQNQNPPVNTGANLIPINENQVDINTGVPGLLEIPDLKIKVPIIWSKDPKNFDQDLQVGVVHYPGTAMPGELGTTYISGHSSNYVWAKGSYNQIFSKLGNLALNTSFKITVVQTNGKDAVFNYVVTKSQQYTPTDQAQFQNTAKSVVALSTCWPVGSTAKRLVVFGELTQVVK